MGRIFSAIERDLGRIYIATVFFALHWVLVVYINSSLLEKYLGEENVGFAYAIGSILGVILLSRTPHILRSIGNKAMMICLSVANLICLFVLAFGDTWQIIAPVFILHHAIIPTILFNFDVFIEHYSKRDDVGRIRGTYLSIINIMYVSIPLAAGILLAKGGFPVVYLIASLAMIPFILAVGSIRQFIDSTYTESNLLTAMQAVLKRHNVRNIVYANFILQVFYGVMVIYMALHLRHLGFDWTNIGLIFTVMLTPFVLFTYPLGRIADLVLGEKEILILGFTIMAVSTSVIPFITSTSVVLWAGLLFITRVGASFVEIMAESYFFKKIKPEDTNLLSIWRSMSGISYATVPLIASGILFFHGSTAMLFGGLAATCLLGVLFGLRIKDTL